MTSVTASTASPVTRAASVDQPLISVITPSYNQGAFIERCIRAVLDQNYPNFEHIVYDNCSTDNTLEVLRRYAHVDWVSEPDRGQSDALNKGFRRARGEIIAWINADDYYEPGAFAVAARELNRDTGVQVVMGRNRVVDVDGHEQQVTVPNIRDLDHLLDLNAKDLAYSQPGLLFRRDVLDRVGLLDTSLHYAMDYELLLRIAGQYHIKVIDDVIATFVMHPDCKTGQERRRGLGKWTYELLRASRRHWGRWYTAAYWRRRQRTRRYLGRMTIHALLGSHKHDTHFDWRLVRDLAYLYPQGLLQRYVAISLIERLLGRRPQPNASDHA